MVDLQGVQIIIVSFMTSAYTRRFHLPPFHLPPHLSSPIPATSPPGLASPHRQMYSHMYTHVYTPTVNMSLVVDFLSILSFAYLDGPIQEPIGHHISLYHALEVR